MIGSRMPDLVMGRSKGRQEQSEALVVDDRFRTERGQQRP